MKNLEQNLSIEKALQQLEDIITQMDTNQLELAASLSLYEDGMKLIAFCRNQLSQAQAKVELIQTTKEKIELQELAKDAWL